MFFQYSCFLFDIIVDNWRQVADDNNSGENYSNLQTKAETMKRFILADQYEDIYNGWDVEANSWEEALAIGKAEGWDIVMWVEINEYSEWIGDIEFT